MRVEADTSTLRMHLIEMLVKDHSSTFLRMVSLIVDEKYAHSVRILSHQTNGG